MAIGIVMGVMMVAMMGAMFLGGHRGKHSDHTKEAAPVVVSSTTVQNSTAPVEGVTPPMTQEHSH